MEPYTIGTTVFHVLTADELTGMRSALRDQQNRIEELEKDVESWKGAYMDASTALTHVRNAKDALGQDAANQIAQEKAEADLFHAAYVGMCAMHPCWALSIGHSQQEH